VSERARLKKKNPRKKSGGVGADVTVAGVVGRRGRSKGEGAMDGAEVRGAFALVQDCRAGNGNCSRGVVCLRLCM
jgi:hypothetical protein